MIQTAEGALNETHDILQRMRELSVQAANDTNNPDDRNEIQKEMNQLTSEVNRIGNTTEFNTQKLLNGNKVGTATTAGTVTEQKSKVTFGTLEISSKLTGTAGDAQSVEFVKAEGTNADLSVSYDGTSKKLTITLGTNDTGAVDSSKNTNTLIAGAIVDDLSSNAAFSVSAGTGTEQQTVAAAKLLAGGRDAGTTVAKDGAASLQIGANQSQQFTVTINDMRASALGIAGPSAGLANGKDEGAAGSVSGASFTATGKGDMTGTDYTTSGEQALDVSSADKASAATKVIDLAIKTVSAERSRLGAYQNRLDHTINNLGTASENLTAAESRIRDVDYALAA